MSAKKLNWGVIGPGKIAHQFARALLPHSDSCLFALASRGSGRADRFAAKYEIPHCYLSYDALCQDDEVDVVYIATPHAFHFQQAKMCLEAGKHVLVEKPATINAKQWQSLTDIAKQNQCTLIEAVWSRFMPCFKQVKCWIDEGKIGKLTYVQSDIGFSFLDMRNADYQHRLFDLSVGGGALLDLGIYSIALSQLAIGSEPEIIQAMADIGPSGVDQTTLVNVCYKNGMRSQFTCSAVSEPSNEMIINGTKGHIKLPGLFWFGGAATLVQSLDNGQASQEQTLEFPHAINGFEYQIDEMCRCIRLGEIESHLMSHGDTLQNTQLMDDIRDQIKLSYPPAVEGLG